MAKAVADLREDIGGGLLVYPVRYVPKPDWTQKDGLPRCTSKCPAGIKEPAQTSYVNQLLQAQANGQYVVHSVTYICACVKGRVTEGTYCQPALVALREKASR